MRSEIPESIRKYLKDNSVSTGKTGSIKISAQSDLTEKGKYSQTWIAAGTRALVVINSASVSHKLYYYKTLTDLKIENMVSTGVLSVKDNGKDTLLLRFSNTQAQEFGDFTRITLKLMGGKRLSEKDYSKENFSPICPECGLRYPNAKRRICPKCLNRRSLFFRLLTYMPKYRNYIILILLFIVISSILRLFTPFLSGRILFDEVLAKGGRYFGMIAEIVLLMIGIRLITVLFDILYGRLNAKFTAKVFYDLKIDIYSSIQKLSYGFFTKKQTGGLMTRINWDTFQLQYLFIDGVTFFIANIFTIIGIIIVMFFLDWRLSLLVIGPTPIIVFLSKGILPKFGSLLSRRFRKRRVLNSMINDTLSGVRVVKSFGKEPEEIRRFQPANTGVFSSNLDLIRFQSSVFPVLVYIMRLSRLLVWGFGGWMVVSGDVSFGILFSFTGYLALIYQPLQFMTMITDWGANAMNAAQRIFEIMDTIPEVAEKTNPVHIQNIKGKIDVQHITFAYEPNKPVLHDITFSIKPGEMIGLIGHTGAGKSTITNLITRLYDVNEGVIRIDGIDVKDIAVNDLRSQVGIVLQDTCLFNSTIAENISYARPDASLKEIVDAAKLANAHDFIVELPDGYDTLLGKKGKDLSGGEKQRLAIARAILHSPRILIFDEATSSIDTKTEHKIQEAIGRMVEGRTTIAIAHRLSTLRRADRLVVIDKGKLKEIGTHDELIQAKGKYWKMFKSERKALRVIAVGDE